MGDSTVTEQNFIVDDSLTCTAACTVNFGGTTISGLANSVSPTVKAVTFSSATIVATDEFVEVNNAGTVTLTLPATSTLKVG